MKYISLFVMLVMSLATIPLYAQCDEYKKRSSAEIENFSNVLKEVKQVAGPADDELFALAKKYGIKKGSLREETQEQFKKDHPKFVAELARLIDDYERRKANQVIKSCKKHELNDALYQSLIIEYRTCPEFKYKVIQSFKR